jgi:hypothetical protein
VFFLVALVIVTIWPTWRLYRGLALVLCALILVAWDTADMIRQVFDFLALGLVVVAVSRFALRRASA